MGQTMVEVPTDLGKVWIDIKKIIAVIPQVTDRNCSVYLSPSMSNYFNVQWPAEKVLATMAYNGVEVLDG